jgi:sarcosine oxidase, subunit beta
LDQFDVAIVGAGVHGASAAFHLSTRGVGVAIFDQRGPAGGPTGRSSAICRAYYTNEFLAELAKRSIEMLADFENVVGGPAGFKRTGFLWLHPARDVAVLETTVRRLTRAGVMVEKLDPVEVAREYPDLNLDGVASALWERDAGYADPTLTTTSLINRSVQMGAKASLYSKVVSLVRTAGGFVVESDQGPTVHAKRLLIAAGPWSRGLARMVGADLPLTVERHVVAVIRSQTAHRIRFGHADLVSGQYYCKPEGEDMYCLGPLVEAESADPDSFDQALGSEEGFVLTQAVASRVPAFHEAELVGGWASLYDVSPDWQPVIGEIGQGVFVDAGTSGHGFKLAPALGAVVADMVMGIADPRLVQFHPGRFGAGHTLEAGYGAARILG